MASYAPVHEQRLREFEQSHVFDCSVTLPAIDAAGYVYVVSEVHMIRQVVNPVPSNWNSRGVALSHRGEHGAVGKDLGVTGHTCLCAGHAGEGRFIDRGVAIAAVDAQFCYMMAVAKEYWLIQ